MRYHLIVPDSLWQAVDSPIESAPEALVAPLRQRKGPSGRKFSDEARNQKIIHLFLGGSTSAEIAAAFGVGPNAICQLLRRYGIKRSQGGKEVAAAKRRAAAQVAKINAQFKAWDATPSEFTDAAELKGAIEKFNAQKHRAEQREIGWELTFGSWWRIWKKSGLWQKRGRSAADSAVMARHGDVGPYSESNVYIITLADNFKESWVTSPGRMAHRIGVRVTKERFIHAPSVFRTPIFETATDRNPT